MILDIEPVADVFALAIDGDRLAAEGFEDDHGDEFFRELEGPVVVRAIGDDHRQAVGVAPSTGEVIRGCLARGVRGMRVVRGGFGEEPRLSK